MSENHGSTRESTDFLQKNQSDPSDSHGITWENLMRAFPVALDRDARLKTLGETTAKLLAERPEEIDRLRIYPDIDRLPEELLDILAYDFKVDWWDPDYSLEQKRRILKDNWNVHRRLGTKWAVTTALGNVHPGASVSEWFEYGGNPYCFRLHIPVTEPGFTLEKQERVIRRVWYYKNLRSHLDRIEYRLSERQDTLHTGGHVSTVVRLPIPEQKDEFDFRSGVRLGNPAVTTIARLPVPEQPDNLFVRSRARVGGKMAIHAKLPGVRYRLK